MRRPDKIKKEKRFEIVYQEGGFMSAKTIYVDKETGVNYLFTSADMRAD